MALIKSSWRLEVAWLVLGCVCLLGLSAAPSAAARRCEPAQMTSLPVPTEYERMVLRLAGNIVKFFKAHAEEVWPGYDLSRRPFLIYVPERWALLINHSGPVEGFQPYPREWPDLGTAAIVHPGRLGDLAGQLAFDFQIGGIKTAAVGLPARAEEAQGLGGPELRLTELIVHENFHQYQNEAFGEIPWLREERYPILDVENTADAAIEMRLLMDALASSAKGRPDEVKARLREFAAIRDARWERGRDFVAPYEQGQEIREGTAQFVQLRTSLLMSAHGFLTPGLTVFPDRLLEDFLGRLAGLAVTPDDMLRNRIYPVGSALGLLLDGLGIPWKSQAQAAGEEFAFHRVIAAALPSAAGDAGLRADEVRRSRGFEAVMAAALGLVREYKDGFLRDLAAFDASAGTRVEIELVYRGISRSRSSLGRTWLLDDGRRSLNTRYRVYTLKNDDLQLEIHGSGILEENDWDRKWKKTVFFGAGPVSISADGRPIDPADAKEAAFRSLEIRGENFSFRAGIKGHLTADGGVIRIRLDHKDAECTDPANLPRAAGSV